MPSPSGPAGHRGHAVLERQARGMRRLAGVMGQDGSPSGPAAACRWGRIPGGSNCRTGATGPRECRPRGSCAHCGTAQTVRTCTVDGISDHTCRSIPPDSRPGSSGAQAGLLPVDAAVATRPIRLPLGLMFRTEVTNGFWEWIPAPPGGATTMAFMQRLGPAAHGRPAQRPPAPASGACPPAAPARNPATCAAAWSAARPVLPRRPGPAPARATGS